MSVNSIRELLFSSTRNGRIQIEQRNCFSFFSDEYATAQTGTVIIAAPAAGKRIVIKADAIATNSDTGEISILGTADSTSIIIAKLYSSKNTRVSQGAVNVPLDEATGVTLTTETGTSKVLVKLNYIIEDL
jgi:hypothetical protein